MIGILGNDPEIEYSRQCVHKTAANLQFFSVIIIVCFYYQSRFLIYELFNLLFIYIW